ncbi:hypothetical protein HYG81_13410 [Natrinema zhouii]|uniref:Uncharacterized protein n=1 Tax=Natrinema zhouii TaxID=1710539 RepID=A0A7D6CNG6_9EURY|nr:hypothetical protein [Natrinema zhouii]QLK25094.1 hypothetical protein HYG81_13410 [Natrinema zhouii]
MPSAPIAPHSEIATRLASRLCIVFAIGGFCTLILLPWHSILSVPLVLLVNLIVIWFTVHYVFAALNDLLEVKLEDSNQSPRSDA